MGQYDTALVVYTKSLDLFKKLNHPYASMHISSVLATWDWHIPGYQILTKAEEYLLTAIDTLAGLW